MKHLVAALLPLAAPAAAQVTLYATAFDDLQGWVVTVGCNPQYGAWGVQPFYPSYGVPAPSPARALGFTSPLGFWPSVLLCGQAASPVVDLTGATDPVLTCAYFWDHEGGCRWDAFGVEVRSAATGAVLFQECLSQTGLGLGHWAPYRLHLDPSWGGVHVVFTQDTIDGWNGWETGCWVDDLAVVDEGCVVVTQCTGAPQSGGGPGARLAVAGSPSIGARDLVLLGSGFPTHTYAAAFAGPDTASIPLGAGVRCVGVGTSVRLAVAPTRDLGSPVWTLDLGAPPLAQMAFAGRDLFVQTIFRDGATLNLSDALRLRLCP